MVLLRSILNRLQKYESVQTGLQAYWHLSDIRSTSKWILYPTLYRMISALKIPRHDFIRQYALSLTDQGLSIGRFYLAQSLFLQNRLSEAKEALHAFLCVHPNHSDGLYLLVQIYKRQNRKNKAIALLTNFLKHSKRRKTWQHLSNLIDNQIDFQQFYALFEQYYPDHRKTLLPYDLAGHFSNACVRVNRYDLALELWRKQYRLLKQGKQQPAQPPALRQYSDDKAEHALSELKRCFHQSGIEFFLISGTLLGCIREGRLLGHDKDIDLGVWETCSVELLSDIIANSGCFYILPVYSPDILVVRHVNGVTVDIFIHHREANDYWHAGGKSKWHNSPFKLTPYPFLNNEYLIPANYDKYLTENYGDWRTPQLAFDSALDTPNMSIISQNDFLIYLYKKINFALHTGKRPSERYLNILCEHGEYLD